MARARGKTWVVVSSSRRAADLGAALAAAGLPHRRITVVTRELFVVPAVAEPVADVPGSPP
jgi:hypothetical protein